LAERHTTPVYGSVIRSRLQRLGFRTDDLGLITSCLEHAAFFTIWLISRGVLTGLQLTPVASGRSPNPYGSKRGVPP
jgi:hypothetical protein